MTDKNELENILQYTDHYSQVNNKSLENRLENLELSREQRKKAIADSTKDTAKDKVKDVAKNFVPPIGYALEFWDWNKKIDEDLNEVKKVMLLEKYFNKSDHLEEAIEN